MQPTVLFPTSSVLIGRPVGRRNTSEGLCKVFSRVEDCGQRDGMVDAWELYDH